MPEYLSRSVELKMSSQPRARNATIALSRRAITGAIIVLMGVVCLLVLLSNNASPVKTPTTSLFGPTTNFLGVTSAPPTNLDSETEMQHVSAFPPHFECLQFFLV